MILSVSNRSDTDMNGKKLLCRTMTAHKYCNRMKDCSYAHDLQEQQLDAGKLIALQIMFDRDMECPEDQLDQMYYEALSMCRLCDGCVTGDCTGGYNCRNGTCHPSLLICCDDLFSGSCDRPTYLDPIPEIGARFGPTDDDSRSRMRCCAGYHITSSNTIPYNEYVRQKCEQYHLSPNQEQIDPFQQKDSDYDELMDFRDLDKALAEYLQIGDDSE